MRPRTPALILCSLLVALAGCSSGDADGAASGSSAQMSAQDTARARQGKRTFDLSQQRCRDWKGKKPPPAGANEVVIGYSGGDVTVSPKGGTKLIVQRGQPIVFESQYAFAVEIPGVGLQNPGQRRVSVKKPPKGVGKADIPVKTAAMCGEFKYTVSVVVDGAPHVMDPEGEIWPSLTP